MQGTLDFGDQTNLVIKWFSFEFVSGEEFEANR